jgi:AcrR family transcriptional regulator
VSPKSPDPAVRSGLIDAAARLLASGGPGALKTRALAAEVGTSTMAVYTHFSGMAELRAAVRSEGFERLGKFLDAVAATNDPVADVSSLGVAYITNALTNPHLYRFMFVEPLIDGDPDAGLFTFEILVAGVARAIEAGRFAAADPERLATQLWATAHGTVTLHLSGLLTIDELAECSSAMALALFVAFGDDPRAARASIAATAGAVPLPAPA